MRTYDVQITNNSTNEESVFWRAANKGYHTLTPPLKGFGDPDVPQLASMYSPVRMAVA